jgi:hypothetical protein
MTDPFDSSASLTGENFGLRKITRRIILIMRRVTHPVQRGGLREDSRSDPVRRPRRGHDLRRASPGKETRSLWNTKNSR